jgi:hypothetical protein
VNALLVRIGADRSAAGGSWNGPVDGRTGQFVYVPIPEGRETHPGLEKPYALLASELARFGVELPLRLRDQRMHLDPDFEQLTYGDRGERAKQLRANLSAGDLIVFYAGLADVAAPSTPSTGQDATRRARAGGRLVYAIVGIMVVDEIVRAVDVPVEQRDCNAHTRRVLEPGADDVVVRARPGVSGRLRTCLPIGEYRDRAYRVRPDILDAWGGLTVKDGYLQRSGRLPRFLDPRRFLEWLEAQRPTLIAANNSTDVRARVTANDSAGSMPAVTSGFGPPRIYVYKLVSDVGAAPCVEDGLLSLAICKPMIRRAAEPGDLIFGFAGRSMCADAPVPADALLYVARIDEKLPGDVYFADERFAARRDCVYRRTGDRFEQRPGALHHTRPENLVHDLGEHPGYPKAWVLLSRDFRYFGSRGTDDYKSAFPLVAGVVERLGRGHRVNHEPALRRELLELKEAVWRDVRESVVGRPCMSPVSPVESAGGRSCTGRKSIRERG